MNTKRKATALAGALTLGLMGAGAQAAPILLEFQIEWTAADFDVSSTGPTVGALGIPEEDDDKVFGIAPSDGSLSFQLLVDPSSMVYVPAGSAGNPIDWYGYGDVSLVAPVTLGTAVWDGSGIIDLSRWGYDLPLWTDTDITTTSPTQAEFRMFGDWTGHSADLFIEPGQVLLWEYYKGEEIRITDPNQLTIFTTGTPPAVPVSNPAGLWLGAMAALGWVAARRRRG